MEFTCGVRNTSEEILQKVLLDLLSPEEIVANGGKIPSRDYALKVFGSDEFLVRDVPIGKEKEKKSGKFSGIGQIRTNCRKYNFRQTSIRGQFVSQRTRC